MKLTEFAPAKINLSLHVVGKRDDGYHNLHSLVTFANYGDDVSFEAGGDAFTLTIIGNEIEGDISQNLIIKAAIAFKAQYPLCEGGAFHLTKNLPIASGMGGGSSDAAAALRLLQRVNGGDIMKIAKTLGADVPICIDAKTRMMTGIGHDLGEIIKIEPLHAILVNPRVDVPTKEIFTRLKINPQYSLDKMHNDLEKPAIAFAPVIGELLIFLKTLPKINEARMSGSGATCFALFNNESDTSIALAILHNAHPNYWVKQVVLGL